LPGDRISSIGHTVYINGKQLKEPYLNLAAISSQGACSESAFDIPKQYSEHPIPPGHYFVMGDCRGISDDSRFWGTVPISSVIGKAVASSGDTITRGSTGFERAMPLAGAISGSRPIN